MGRKISILLLVFSVMAGFGLWGWSFFRTEIDIAKELARQLPKDVNIDVSAKGVTIKQGSGGDLVWELTADSAAYNTKQGTVQLANPVITYHTNSTNGTAIIIRAPEGEVNQQENTMVLTPRVKANYGQVLVTGNRLDYFGKERRIVITGDAVIDRGDLVMEGPRIEIDLTTQNMIAPDGAKVVTMGGAMTKSSPESKK